MGRVRDLRAAGRGPRAPRSGGGRRRRPGRDQLDRDPRRLGRPLARFPRAGPGRWRADGRPPLLGGRPPAPDAEVEAVVDPGQAFGTGAHATTRMCLELLLELADAGEAGGRLVDLGTGSGVLAIAAAKLGWSPVIGCDSEAASIEAAGDNAAANDVSLELIRCNLREQQPPEAPTVVANLTAPLLEAVAERLASPRTLVCSGLLVSELDRVSAALSAAGLTVASERAEGDWAALLARAV